MNSPTIRAAQPADLEAILRLCDAHVEFEKASIPRDGQGLRLEAALFGSPVRLWCLLVEQGGELGGYATYSREFSTWRARDYLHLDCLYLEPNLRGSGLGRALMSEVARHARKMGLRRLEWQTPQWNTAAIGFYERLGACGAPKVRFSWEPTPDHGAVAPPLRGCLR